MRFRTGLALSALGLAGAVVGIYWDPINGRGLVSGSIGTMQMLIIGGGAILCVLGAALLVLPRREPSPARPVKAAIRPSAGERRRRPLKKRRADGRRRRNTIRR